MRFSYAIMNPPYDRNLHLKFLEKVIKVADKTINISPVRWLQNAFAPYLKSSDYNKFEESISKHIESLEIIPASKATEAFTSAAFIMNLGIYTCSSKGGYDYIHNESFIRKIVEKTRESNWLDFAYNKHDKSKLKPYIIMVSGVHSNDSKYPLLCQTYERQLEVKEPNSRSHNSNNFGLFSFDTEEERHNFYDCYNTQFMIWETKLWKSGISIYTRNVPYFGDYTKHWTNAMFCEYFGITGFISDTEAEPGSEWETILKAMKK